MKLIQTIYFPKDGTTYKPLLHEENIDLIKGYNFYLKHFSIR